MAKTTVPTDTNTIAYEGVYPVGNGANVATEGGAVATDAAGVTYAPQVVQVKDGTGTNKLAVDASGKIGVSSLPALPAGSNAIGSVSVSNFPATQTVSVTSLPELPAGVNIIGQVQVTDGTNVLGTSARPVRVDPTGTTPQPVSGTVAVSSLPALSAGSNAIGSVSVSNWPATQAISAASLPLPTNAAQETGGNLATLAATVSGGKVATSEANSGTIATQTTTTATQATAIATATGTQADAAWSSGNGSLVALLKAIATELAGTVLTNPTTGSVVSLVTPPATLTAGADTSLTFAQQVRHVYLQNKSGSDVYIAFDTTASAGTYLLPGGTNALATFDVRCTVLHVYCGSALNVNGTSSGNLVVEGRL